MSAKAYPADILSSFHRGNRALRLRTTLLSEMLLCMARPAEKHFLMVLLESASRCAIPAPRRSSKA